MHQTVPPLSRVVKHAITAVLWVTLWYALLMATTYAPLVATSSILMLWSVMSEVDLLQRTAETLLRHGVLDPMGFQLLKATLTIVYITGTNDSASGPTRILGYLEIAMRSISIVIGWSTTTLIATGTLLVKSLTGSLDGARLPQDFVVPILTIPTSHERKSAECAETSDCKSTVSDGYKLSGDCVTAQTDTCLRASETMNNSDETESF